VDFVEITNADLSRPYQIRMAHVFF
jgi:hypothetical protein